MGGSILTETKRSLGIAEANTDFDTEIIMHINTAFSALNGLGIGPDLGFEIEDATPTWDAFFGTNLKYNPVKSYVYVCAKIAFDPPLSAWHLMNSLEKQKVEIEWRLSVIRESTAWVSPNPPSTDTDNDDDDEIDEFFGDNIALI